MKTLSAIGYVTCNHCGGPLDPETLRCDCRDDDDNTEERIEIRPSGNAVIIHPIKTLPGSGIQSWTPLTGEPI